MNQVTIIGNLGADPEVRFTQGGTAVANLRVATNERWTDAQGQKQEQTEWHRVSVFGKQAEACGEFLTKGRQVAVSGRLQTREYDDKEGVKRWSTEIVAHHVEFLGGGRGDDAPPEPRSAPSPAAAPTPRPTSTAGRGDLPTTFPGFGRSKGQPIAGAASGDLDFYANAANRSLANPEKARFHEKERALLDAINAERDRQGGGGGDAGAAPSDEEIPF